jgi:hypothetical protein
MWAVMELLATTCQMGKLCLFQLRCYIEVTEICSVGGGDDGAGVAEICSVGGGDDGTGVAEICSVGGWG